MPFARIASRCAPRATRLTSWPAAASLAPSTPPIAPAPTTQTFMRRVPSPRPRARPQPCASGRDGPQRAHAPPLRLFPGPRCAFLVRARLLRRQVCARPGERGQLEPKAVRVEEIDRLDELVVGRADHLDAARLEPTLRGLELRDRSDA